MISLRPAIAAAVAVFAVTLATLMPAQAADLATRWNGSYAYIDGRPPVPFTLTLTTKGKTISGHIEEKATFGDGTSDELVADIVGTAFDFNVTFTKIYDGTGGQKHTVEYRGTIDGKTMYGFWQLGEDVGAWYATAAK